MLHLADPPWWRSVFFDQLGAAFIGGLIAFGIALLTLRITRSREERAANLQTSREIAKNLNGAVADLQAWVLDPTHHDDAARAFLRLVIVDAPVLTDRELPSRQHACRSRIGLRRVDQKPAERRRCGRHREAEAGTLGSADAGARRRRAGPYLDTASTGVRDEVQQPPVRGQAG